MSIYLGSTKITGTGVQVDGNLSTSSYNAVANAPVSQALEDLGVNTYTPPADWVDIRSGAVENSITLLVAHSTPTESGGVYTVATYPQFHILAQVSTAANTYDVFVDGVKVATTASGTKTVIDWGTLYGAGTVSTIYTTTNPEALVYHIVRVSPTTATDTLTQFQNNVDSSNTNQGILWAHYQLSNPIAIYMAFGGGSRPRNTILQAVTAKNDTLIYTVGSSGKMSGFYSTFAYCSSLVKVPVLQAESQTYASGQYVSFRGVPAKRIIIKNNSGLETFGALNNSKIGELIAENGLSFESTLSAETSSANINNLKKLPAISSNMGENILISRADSLQDTVIDDSTNTNRKVFRFFGTAAYPNTGLKGLTVSSSAPFDGASPQINISYTALNRAALVNLFKSLPTVAASQVCQVTGATGAADLTATDLAIATGKGWTVTR